jgi:hypothetical protein
VTATHYGLRPDGPGDTLHKGALENCTAADCADRAAESIRSTVRALTVRQPFAFAIAGGFKTIENRTRRTNHRGEIYLHTSKAPEKSVSIVRHCRDAAIRLDELGGSGNFWDAIAVVPSRFYTPNPTLALGAVIATARIAGCHRSGEGCLLACEAWGEPDVWHWEVSDARPLAAAVPAKGALGLWSPTADVIKAVRAQVDTTTLESS